MKKINLRELYPDVYTTDFFVDVTEEVMETIRAAERAETAYERNYQLQKSEAFQSVHHVTFILCYTVLYNFLGLRFATVGAKRTSTGCPAPLYLPLSEFVNTGGTI